MCVPVETSSAGRILRLVLTPSFQEWPRFQLTPSRVLLPGRCPRTSWAGGKSVPGTNHATGFNRCTSEIQDKINSHINLLNETIVKGKAPKEVVEAIKDLKDLSAFHSSVSVVLETALQHLANSLFVQLHSP